MERSTDYVLKLIAGLVVLFGDILFPLMHITLAEAKVQTLITGVVAGIILLVATLRHKSIADLTLTGKLKGYGRVGSDSNRLL